MPSLCTGIRLAVLVWTTLFCAACTKQASAPVVAPQSLLSRPHVTLVAVTDWQATLKPCGCTVELQKGGIERIAQWLGELRQQDDSVLVVHAGSLLHDGEVAAAPAAQAQFGLRRQVFAQTLQRLGTAAVALSGWDLAHGGTETALAYAQAKWPVLALGAPPAGVAAQSSLLTETKSGVSVGLIGVDGVAGTDDAQRLELVRVEVAKVRQQGAQVVVVLSNLGLRGSRRMARAVTGIDAMVVGQLDERGEPLRDMEREGDTLLVHAARHGAWMAALTLVPNPAGGGWLQASEFLPGAAADLEARQAGLQAQFDAAQRHATLATQLAKPFYVEQLTDLQQRLARAKAAAGQPVPAGKLAAFRSVGLLWSAPVDDTVAALVKTYDAAAAASAEKLAVQPVPAVLGQATYIGHGNCLTCHMPTQAFAMNDAHSKAWQTLEKVGKTRDLDCVPCHVTAWQLPGGSALGNLDKFQAVRCEACHGPGSLHAAGPVSGEATRPGMPALVAEKCAVCHTAQHSPRFDFAQYRQRLLVPGHGARMLDNKGK